MLSIRKKIRNILIAYFGAFGLSSLFWFSNELTDLCSQASLAFLIFIFVPFGSLLALAILHRNEDSTTIVAKTILAFVGFVFLVFGLSFITRNPILLTIGGPIIISIIYDLVSTQRIKKS